MLPSNEVLFVIWTTSLCMRPSQRFLVCKAWESSARKSLESIGLDLASVSKVMEKMTSVM